MAAFAVAFSASAAMAGVYVTGSLPSEFDGGFGTGSGFLPSDPDVFKALGKSSKEGSKLSAGVAKCFSKGAKNVSKGSPSGVDTCINNSKKGVLTKYNAKYASIDSKSPLPPCHINRGATIAYLSGAYFNPQIYCQSPSGAFIDEAGF